VNRINIKNIDIQIAIEKAKAAIREDRQISAGTKSIVEILILVITILANRLDLNSKNSSKPTSTYLKREIKAKTKSGSHKGDQKERDGITLQKVDDPDVIEPIKIDRPRCRPVDFTIWATRPVRCLVSTYPKW
jgi:transposase